jgi:UDP:flavonoid glycosyltransferase YjiC (YdhE family)
MDKTPPELAEWLSQGERPVYIGFGSNGVGNTDKFASILMSVLEKTKERILFCTGWSVFNNLPVHKNLFVTKYINHEAILPLCKAGVFHGGAGTLATMLRNNVPVVIVSFYTDQPTWGKIITRKKLGVHIPAKSLTANKLISAIQSVQTDEVKRNIAEVGQAITNENGLANIIHEIETYFNTNTAQDNVSL